MATLVRVPEVAAGATEVTLSEWLVEDGATLAKGDVIAVVETEKAVVEIESDAAGVLIRRLAEPSTEIEVGSALVLLGSPEEAEGDADALLAQLGARGARAAEPEPAEEPEVEPEPEPETEPAAEGGSGERERIFASPLARRLLAEGGVDITTVTGSGPHGRITKKDALAAVEAAEKQPEEQPEEEAEEPPVSAAPAGTTDEPHSRLRRAVAARLTESKQTVPHFYVRRTVRVDALLALREQLNAVSATRISVNDLVVRAVATAHAAVPEANVIWTDDAMRSSESVDIGVAIASERGLVTPVLRDVQRSTPSAIAQQVRTYVDQANQGRLQQRDLEGGTISVTNLGMYGVDDFDAIINPPQSAILAVGAAREAAVVEQGAVVVGRVMSLVLSVDHRAIDGALAARWMAALVESLESPMRLLA